MYSIPQQSTLITEQAMSQCCAANNYKLSL